MADGKKMLILYILEILKRHSSADNRLTQSDIAAYLRREYGMTVDRKSIKRNLLELVYTGYPIEYRESTRVMPNGETLDVLTDWYYMGDFEEAEVLLIADSLRATKHIPHHQREALIQKVERLAGEYRSPATRIQQLPTSEADNPDFFLSIEVLGEAIAKGRQVSFLYCDYGTDKALHPKNNRKGKPLRYVVNPYQMAVANGRYYLVGNFDYYDNLAHYRIDRIKDITLLDTPCKPLETLAEGKYGLALPAHLVEHIYMFSGESGMVTFRAKKYILNDIIDWFGTDIRLFDESEDEISVTVRVNYQAMHYWALQYAPHATILSPKALVEEVCATLRAGYARYQTEAKGESLHESGEKCRKCK